MALGNSLNLTTILGIDSSGTSPFADLISVTLTPLIQLDFTYGINTQTGTSTTVNSAVVDTTASILRLQTGVNSAGAATFVSQRNARYRPGQGIVARFTFIFASSAANSTQVIGMGGTSTGYFFGYNGTVFGISRRKAGSDNWVAQTDWNGDKCLGTGPSGFNWNKTLGNVCQIKYPYLGYGAITFWVQNPVDATWILCHTIQYPNSSADVQVSNPSLPFYANATNSGNTTNLISYCGSVGVFLCGDRQFLGPQWCVDNTKTVTTELNIFSLRNATTYNTITNTGAIRLRSISISYAAAGNNTGILRLKKGVTLGGSPSFTSINGTTGDNGVTITSGNSVASFDIAGTTITGGTYIYAMTVGGVNSETQDLTPFNIIISPNETLTFSAQTSGSGLFLVSANWNEDI